MLLNKLRGHRKKKHHLGKGGYIDPHRTEESSLVQVLGDESVMREHKTDKGHTDKLGEQQQPTMVRVTSDVQMRELKTAKFDTAQSCNLVQPTKVEVVKDVEEQKGELMVKSSNHKKKKKRLNMKKADILQMSENSESYEELSQTREPEKTERFQKTVTLKDWDTYNDEKPDVSVKEIQVEKEVQIAAEIKVDTDPEKTVQSTGNVDEKR